MLPERRKVAAVMSFLILAGGVVFSHQPKSRDDVTGQQADVIGQLRNMIRKQQEDFEQRLQQQQKDFNQKLQQQEEIFEQKLQQKEEDFEQKLQVQRNDFDQQREEMNQEVQNQDQLIRTLTYQVTENRKAIERLNGELEKEKTEKEMHHRLLENQNHQKRSDDIDALQVVISHVSQQVDDITAQVQALKNEDQNLRNAVTTATDSLYVRWGSSTCASTTQLVYSGLMGGSFYSHSGGAPNPLCLPMNPVYTSDTHNNHADFGHAGLYGAEYETHPYPSHNLDALCAVCRSSKTTTLMIPATNACLPGWTLEYSGYLMANDAAHASGNEYICVDSKFEGRPGTQFNSDGFLLYFTLGHCGSLPCPPYKGGDVILCVVCSK